MLEHVPITRTEVKGVFYAPSLFLREPEGRVVVVNAAWLWDSSAKNTRQGSVCICGAPRCVPPSGVVLGRRRSERGSLHPASFTPDPRRWLAGLATKQGLRRPRSRRGLHRGVPRLGQQAEACKGPSHSIWFLSPKGWRGPGGCASIGRGRGGGGGVRAAHSQVINARFRWGAAAFPWQRSASRMPPVPAAGGCAANGAALPFLAAAAANSSYAWYSSSSTSRVVGSGPLHQSLSPELLNTKKICHLRGAPDGDAHHRKNLLHPAGTEAVSPLHPGPDVVTQDTASQFCAEAG